MRKKSKRDDYMSVEEARVFLAEWAATINAELATANAVDASKWRRTRPRPQSGYPDALLLDAERWARKRFDAQYGREPGTKPGDQRRMHEMIARRCGGLAPNTIKNRLSQLRRKKAGSRSA